MSIRKYKTNPQILLAKGQEIMKSSDGSKFFTKVFAVNMVLSGQSAADVAKSAGLCRSTVSGWVKTVDEQGFEALEEAKRQGRKSRLSPEQYEEIDTIIQQDSTGFGYKVWDGNSLSNLIMQRYGITIKVRQCQYIFHKLGFSRIRPQTFPSKRYEHTEEREAFKKRWRKSGERTR